jgi:hypothetical protein
MIDVGEMYRSWLSLDLAPYFDYSPANSSARCFSQAFDISRGFGNSFVVDEVLTRVGDMAGAPCIDSPLGMKEVIDIVVCCHTKVCDQADWGIGVVIVVSLLSLVRRSASPFPSFGPF